MNIETTETLDKYAKDKYKYGFVTEIDSDRPQKGLSENIIKYISKKKNADKSRSADNPRTSRRINL